MSGFNNPTNVGRVTKMCETLDLIEKSARSNRVSDDEVAALLAPLLARLPGQDLAVPDYTESAPVVVKVIDPAKREVAQLAGAKADRDDWAKVADAWELLRDALGT